MNKIKGVEERGFKGIWIPAEIWLREDINLTEKALLAEIDSLDQGEGCFASNNYLSKFAHVSIRRLQEIIQNLKDKELLEQTDFDGRKRWIKINKDTLFSAYQTCVKVHASKTDVRKTAPLPCEISHPYIKEYNKDTKCIKNTLAVPPEVVPSLSFKPNKKKKKTTSKFKSNSLGGKLSQFLLNEIEKYNPTFPMPDLATWQGTFNKMTFIQGYRYDEIKSVIRYSQQSKFWRSFIINPFAFAAKYETLKIQWMQSREKSEEKDVFDQAKEETF